MVEQRSKCLRSSPSHLERPRHLPSRLDVTQVRPASLARGESLALRRLSWAIAGAQTLPHRLLHSAHNGISHRRVSYTAIINGIGEEFAPIQVEKRELAAF
jgi:hypothetical protein